MRVEVSNQFIHWALALGDGVKIVGPETVVSEVKEEIVRLENMYQ